MPPPQNDPSGHTVTTDADESDNDDTLPVANETDTLLRTPSAVTTHLGRELQEGAFYGPLCGCRSQQYSRWHCLSGVGALFLLGCAAVAFLARSLALATANSSKIPR